jgi:hypothetical protein
MSASLPHNSALQKKTNPGFHPHNPTEKLSGHLLPPVTRVSMSSYALAMAGPIIPKRKTPIIPKRKKADHFVANVGSANPQIGTANGLFGVCRELLTLLNGGDKATPFGPFHDLCPENSKLNLGTQPGAIKTPMVYAFNKKANTEVWSQRTTAACMAIIFNTSKGAQAFCNRATESKSGSPPILSENVITMTFCGANDRVATVFKDPPPPPAKKPRPSQARAKLAPSPTLNTTPSSPGLNPGSAGLMQQMQTPPPSPQQHPSCSLDQPFPPFAMPQSPWTDPRPAVSLDQPFPPLAMPQSPWTEPDGFYADGETAEDIGDFLLTQDLVQPGTSALDVLSAMAASEAYSQAPRSFEERDDPWNADPEDIAEPEDILFMQPQPDDPSGEPQPEEQPQPKEEPSPHSTKKVAEQLAKLKRKLVGPVPCPALDFSNSLNRLPVEKKLPQPIRGLLPATFNIPIGKNKLTKSQRKSMGGECMVVFTALEADFSLPQVMRLLNESQGVNGAISVGVWPGKKYEEFYDFALDLGMISKRKGHRFQAKNVVDDWRFAQTYRKLGDHTIGIFTGNAINLGLGHY